jgi:hypothetical protein
MLVNGQSVYVSSRYYFVGTKTRDHIFDNYPSNSWNEDTVARFSQASVLGVIKEF